MNKKYQQRVTTVVNAEEVRALVEKSVNAIDPEVGRVEPVLPLPSNNPEPDVDSVMLQGEQTVVMGDGVHTRGFNAGQYSISWHGAGWVTVRPLPTRSDRPWTRIIPLNNIRVMALKNG